jgi:hypothetical protein
MYELSAKHPELSSSYAEIVGATDTFLDGMLKANPKNPAANNLKANSLDAGITSALKAKDSAAARTKVQECLNRAEDLGASPDIQLRAVAARLYATAAEALGKLGDAKRAEGEVEKAEHLAREVSSNAKPDDQFSLRNLSTAYSMLGGAEASMDHWDRAVQSYRRNEGVNQKVLDLSSKQGNGAPDFQTVRDALLTRNQEALADFESRNYDDARKVLEQHSLSIAQTLVKWNQDPALKRAPADRALAEADLRDVEIQLGNVLGTRASTWTDALRYYSQALDRAQKLAHSDLSASNGARQEEAALAVARMRKLLGQKEAALDGYNKYIAILREHDNGHPNKDNSERLGFAYHELAAFEAHHGTKSAAPADYQSAIEWLSKVGADLGAQRKLADAHIRLADVESDFGQADQARDNYVKAARATEKCIAVDIQHHAGQEDDAESALLFDYENLAFSRLGMGDRKGASDAIAKLLDSAKAEANNARASLDAKKSAETIDHAAFAFNILGWAELLSNHPKESIQALESVPRETRNQAWIQANLAHAYLISGQFDQASSVYLAHIGEQMYDDRFEISVLDDLAELRKLGFDRPTITRVEKLLGR